MEEVLDLLLYDVPRPGVVQDLLQADKPTTLAIVQELTGVERDLGQVVTEILNSTPNVVYWEDDETIYRITHGRWGTPKCEKLEVYDFKWSRLPEIEARQLVYYRRSYYEHRIPLSRRYKCTLTGNCERSLNDDAQPEHKCERECKPVQYRDLMYLILANNPEQADQLADSDKPRVVKDMLGIDVDVFTAQDMLSALAEQDWLVLLTIPELQEYLDERYDYIDQVLRIVAANCELYGNLPLDWAFLRERLLADEELWAVVHLPVPNLPPDEVTDLLRDRDYDVYQRIRRYFVKTGGREAYGLPDLWQNLAIYSAERDEGVEN